MSRSMHDTREVALRAPFLVLAMLVACGAPPTAPVSSPEPIAQPTPVLGLVMWSVIDRRETAPRPSPG